MVDNMNQVIQEIYTTPYNDFHDNVFKKYRTQPIGIINDKVCNQVHYEVWCLIYVKVESDLIW